MEHPGGSLAEALVGPQVRDGTFGGQSADVQLCGGTFGGHSADVQLFEVHRRASRS